MFAGPSLPPSCLFVLARYFIGSLTETVQSEKVLLSFYERNHGRTLGEPRSQLESSLLIRCYDVPVSVAAVQWSNVSEFVLVLALILPD